MWVWGILGFLGGQQGLKKNMCASSSSLNGKLISLLLHGPIWHFPTMKWYFSVSTRHLFTNPLSIHKLQGSALFSFFFSLSTRMILLSPWPLFSLFPCVLLFLTSSSNFFSLRWVLFFCFFFFTLLFFYVLLLSFVPKLPYHVFKKQNT